MSKEFVLIGCGNMGYAMLRGFLREAPELVAYVVEPVDALRQRAALLGAKAVTSISELEPGLKPALLVIAVKPNLVEAVLQECTALAGDGTIFLSVAAGVTTDTMARNLPVNVAIVRCMPNTPAAIGEGMLAVYAREGLTGASRQLVTTLLQASGAVAWLDRESDMDAVTAISGSGPAYVFHFIEALTAAGIALGLSPETASLLAKQTVKGAGRLAAEATDDPGKLREQVTSPGGTTAAALQVFMTDDRTIRLVAEATQAARDRSIELGKTA
jgi:pyrroline-5-carboxylate reductase